MTPQSLVARLARWRPRPEARSVRPSVLIVDDEESIVRFVQRTLQQGGYDTVTAPNGRAALEAAAAHGPFDMVVTDLMMPQMNGDELVRRLRQIDPHIKVLYLTGYADRLFAERGQLWEDESFLDKPVSVRGLLEATALALTGHVPASVAPPADQPQAAGAP